MVQTPLPPQTLYPDSDGKPMADNTEQYEWIVRLATNLKHLLKDQVAFVAGDLLWYPVQVERDEKAPRQAPDVLVALGRPTGYRGSYRQWEEENIAPQMVFEILSPSNTHREMAAKQKFYEDYGVLEAYYYDPQRQEFWAYVREQTDERYTLIALPDLPWISPLLQIRFEMDEDGLKVFYPNGERFAEPEVSLLDRDTARDERDTARNERDTAQAERDTARDERDTAQAERDAAQQREQQTQQQLDAALAKLRELGIDPETL
ncbi:MAG: Uma2 family endonuclease [Cyanobacteria bacterium P01_G01_bin.54]